jgi:hypothetical protein
MRKRNKLRCVLLPAQRTFRPASSLAFWPRPPFLSPWLAWLALEKPKQHRSARRSLSRSGWWEVVILSSRPACQPQVPTPAAVQSRRPRRRTRRASRVSGDGAMKSGVLAEIVSVGMQQQPSSTSSSSPFKTAHSHQLLELTSAAQRSWSSKVARTSDRSGSVTLLPPVPSQKSLLLITVRSPNAGHFVLTLD